MEKDLESRHRPRALQVRRGQRLRSEGSELAPVALFQRVHGPPAKYSSQREIWLAPGGRVSIGQEAREAGKPAKRSRRKSGNNRNQSTGRANISLADPRSASGSRAARSPCGSPDAAPSLFVLQAGSLSSRGCDSSGDETLWPALSRLSPPLRGA
jgi:hypothetical protein